MDGRRDPGSIRQLPQVSHHVFVRHVVSFDQRQYVIESHAGEVASVSIVLRSEPLPLILKTRTLRPRKSTSFTLDRSVATAAQH